MKPQKPKVKVLTKICSLNKFPSFLWHKCVFCVQLHENLFILLLEAILKQSANSNKKLNATVRYNLRVLKDNLKNFSFY